MAKLGRSSSRNAERSSVWSCYGRSYACFHYPTSNWFLVPVANAGRTPRASPAASNQSVMKQCGAQWQAAKAAGTTDGATWSQFLKACRAQLATTTSAPAQGGFAPRRPLLPPAPTIGFTLSVAAAGNSNRWEYRVDCRRICIATGSSVSLSRINCRLGQ